MPEPLANLRGQLLPLSQAALPLHDAGFVQGVTITDLCRTFAGKLFRWEDHLRRFRQSCELASLAVALSDAEITRQADHLAKHNFAIQGDLCLVVFATPGPIGYYVGEPGGGESTFGIYTYGVPFARFRSVVAEGATLVVPSIRQIPAACIDPRIKQRSRLHWWLADQEIRKHSPGSMALLLNEAGHLTETAAANVLLVQNGVVLSPRRGTILEGVSLQVVRELCVKLNIPLKERDLTLTDCEGVEEALLTNTTFCLAGVQRINDTKLPFPGPLTLRLCNAWNELLGCDIHQRFLQ